MCLLACLLYVRSGAWAFALHKGVRAAARHRIKKHRRHDFRYDFCLNKF